MRGDFELEDDLITQLGKLNLVGDDTLSHSLKLLGAFLLDNRVLRYTYNNLFLIKTKKFRIVKKM